MFTPRVSKNVLGTSRTRKSLATARNSPALTPGRRSLYAVNASRTPLRLSVSLQTTSHTIEDTGTHVVENFGTALPVLVNEALTLADRSRDVSARLDRSGWAWLVCGRRLFVWKYKLNAGQRLSSAPQCRELTLPPSDLAHKAELVCVFPSDDRQVPSALAVSPEGTICYWPSIAHEGSYCEANAELHGQECYSLTNYQSYGCVLATTTSTLILISPSGVGQENTIVCRNITMAKGALARISRRVSSFIFGSMPSQTSESRLVRVLVSNEDESDLKLLYILSGNNLQKWEIGESDCDKLIFDCDVDLFMREKFVENLWSQDMINAHQLKILLVDMQLNKLGLFILASAINPRNPHQIYYALGIVNVHSAVIPQNLSAFIAMSHHDTVQESEEDLVLSYRLLLPDSKSDCAFVYRNNMVLCIPLSSTSEETDKVEFGQQGDQILGAGSFDGLPLFFSLKHGIVSISLSSPEDSMSVANASTFPDAASVSESYSLSCSIAQLEDLAASDDKTSQLKAALLLFCQKNISQSQAIIEDSFPQSPAAVTEVNSVLDVTVVSLSKQTIDDFPATDPRWAETLPQDSGTTTSMIILHQLEDKQKAHHLFLNFLQQSNLWERLQLVSYLSHNVSTRRILCEHSEKLAAAKALRNMQAQYGSLIESAIKVALLARKMAPTGKLTHQDIFYRDVSNIQDIIPSLLEVEENLITDAPTQTVVGTVTSVNNIILTLLRQVSQHQQQRLTQFSTNAIQADGEYVPWTSSTDSSTSRRWLIKQTSYILDHAVKAAHDMATRGNIYQQLMDIIDLVLDGYRCQLQSLEHSSTEPGHYENLVHQYEQDRLMLIIHLLDAEQYERAASLAEKYLDFEVLVRLCELTDNQERLNRYMMQFNDQGFIEFTFKWYLKEGKRGKLLSQPALQQESLQHFLKEHSYLSWLQDMNKSRYMQAHQTLKTLGSVESDILIRKKTMLSLSKLSALVSDCTPEETQATVQDLNQELELILYQETLPPNVLESFGLDIDNMRVLSPEELIEMYVCDYNISANEFDFKKALDLLHFVNKAQGDKLEHLRSHIWCRAILKDSWTNFDESASDALDTCAQTIFFRTVELAFNDGLELKEFLPKVDRLLENEELGALRDNATFRYLIQAGYEQIERIMS